MRNIIFSTSVLALLATVGSRPISPLLNITVSPFPSGTNASLLLAPTTSVASDSGVVVSTTVFPLSTITGSPTLTGSLTLTSTLTLMDSSTAEPSATNSSTTNSSATDSQTLTTSSTLTSLTLTSSTLTSSALTSPTLISSTLTASSTLTNSSISFRTSTSALSTGTLNTTRTIPTTTASSSPAHLSTVVPTPPSACMAKPTSRPSSASTPLPATTSSTSSLPIPTDVPVDTPGNDTLTLSSVDFTSTTTAVDGDTVAISTPTAVTNITKILSNITQTLSKRIAQPDLPDVAQSWQDLCLVSGGDIYTNQPCVLLAGLNGIDALLANADPCAQQDNADAMIDFAKSPGVNNTDALIENAIAYRKHPRNAVDILNVIPSTPFCQRPPRNPELVGLVAGQLPGVNPGIFGGPSFGLVPFGEEGTCPFGTTPDIDSCSCVPSAK